MIILFHDPALFIPIYAELIKPLRTGRKTFLTRLGASGCDVWTLARIAGNSSLAMSYRYVHPSEDRVLDAMTIFLGGHKTGHSLGQEQIKQLTESTDI